MGLASMLAAQQQGGQSGTTSGPPGQQPYGQQGSAPKPGQQPGQFGQQPYGQQGGMPGQQGGMPGQQGGYPGQQGGMPGQQGGFPGQQGGFPGQQQQQQMGQQGGMPGQQPYGQQGTPGSQPFNQQQQQQRPYGQQGGPPGSQPYGQQQGGPGQQQPYGQQGGFPGQQQPYGQQGGFPGQQQSPYGQQPGGAPGQQQYGQQGQFGGSNIGAGPGGPPPQGGLNPQQLQQKLQQIIQQNRLESFYPPPALQNIVNRASRIDFRALAQKYNMPMELAIALAGLALYDIVIFVDDSGSMAFEENGERINDLKLILGRVAEVATMFDDDGILIRFMNGMQQGNGIRDAASASNLISSVQFNGMTPLGSQLQQKVIQPILGQGLQSQQLQKPVLVITITDGEPTGEPRNTIVNVIKQAKNMCMNSRYGPGAITFEFAQVGKDTGAQAFLAQLDNDPEVGRSIDATSYYELEAEEFKRKGVTLTPDVWLVKLMMGAVDSTFDDQD